MHIESECECNESERKYIRDNLECITREIWEVRGWTLKEHWHYAECEDCIGVYDQNGKCKYMTIEDGIVEEHDLGDLISVDRLNVTFYPTHVEVTNALAQNPVTGRSKYLILAYLDWLLNFEKQLTGK